MSPLTIALLCDHRRGGASTVHAHIESFQRYSRHHMDRISMLGGLPPALDLHRFDAVLVHYSLLAGDDFDLSERARQRIQAHPGVKAAFVQDEYRHVDRTAAVLREMGLGILFTCVPDEHVGSVYGEARLPDVKTVRVLTGYVSDELSRLSVPPPSGRPLLVGYRGRYLPAWLGELGQEKWRIGARFLQDAPAYEIACDISWREENRLYGRRWVEFLTRCRAVLGVESGASAIDFTGEIQVRTERYLAMHSNATFEEIRAACFAAEDGRYSLNQISPRCFEAAALRTVMVLYEGGYSGVLEPWRHYIPLRKDHSNMREVAEALRDGMLCDKIAERAYREVALNPLYGWPAMVEAFDREVERAAVQAGYRSSPYPRWELGLRHLPAATTVWRRLQRFAIELVHRWLFGRVLRRVQPQTRAFIRARLRQMRRVRQAPAHAGKPRR